MSAIAKPASGPIHALDARRAYYGFLTHIRYAHSAGLRWPVETVAEFGTGTSLGIGFCALLAGAERYLGFDAVAHMDASAQGGLLEELRGLFRERAPAYSDSGEKAFDFPHHAISVGDTERGLSRSDYMERVTYVAPYDAGCAQRFAQSADLIMSTATLEHVDDMEGGYRLFHAMTKPGGFQSHSIDFKCHGFAKPRDGKRLWNGHWEFTEAEWAKLIKGKAYSINRLPCSSHLQLMLRAGFKLLTINKRMQPSELKWSDLAPRWQWMTAEDLGCSGVHVIARRT